jgi:prepilin-type N-terminal cleavage/methylation domain-containing protein
MKNNKKKHMKKTKNFSFLISHFSFQKGFTLLELLTVIGVLGVIGSIVVSVVFISLRGSKKSDLVEIMRQNGDTAMTQMVKQIRFARSLDTPASCIPTTNTSSITITSIESNTQTTYACSATAISSNSASLIDSNAVSVTNCSFSCSQQTVNDPPTITIQFTLLPKVQGTLAENNASIPFQSSVTLRNYTQ